MVPAISDRILCDRCGTALVPARYNTGDFHRCRCGRMLRIEAFPALFASPPPARNETAVPGEEACCYYHATRKAVAPCDRCGRFICGLCEVTAGQERLCPACIASSIGDGRNAGGALDNKRVCYDKLALLLGSLPAWYITPLLALFIAARHWSSPGGVLTGRATYVARMGAALLLAVGWLSFWTWLLLYLLG